MQSSRHRFLIWALACCTAACNSGCGSFIAPNDNLNGEDTCLDLWSIIHFGTGYAFGNQLGDGSLIPMVGLLTGYELIEPQFWPGYNESELNRGCDVAVGTMGWAAATR